MTRRGYISNDHEVIYLLHFAKPIGNGPRGQAQHYIGRTQGDRLEVRLEEHRAGNGASKITTAFAKAGIDFELAGVFHPEPGERGFQLERTLKAHKKARDFCLVCMAIRVMEKEKGK